jgi:peptidoglycan-associated lipoprotein
MFSARKIVAAGLTIALAMFAAGCRRQSPLAPPPPPPVQPAPQPSPPAAPMIVQFVAEPTSIQQGQSITLRWEVGGPTSSVSIDHGIGAAPSAGSQVAFPNDSATYTLTAAGPGGSRTASVTVTVTAPPPPPPALPSPPSTAPKSTIEQRLIAAVQDAYFDYDKSDIRAEARDVLTRDANALKSILADFPSVMIAVEGHWDERGSAEYNLGLGDQRAALAKDILLQLGIPGDRLRPISYGKERPQRTGSDESCWQKNRRVHFSAAQ